MNKHRAHHYLRWFRTIKPWYFLVIALVSAVVCVFALRANNEHMIELRDAVYAADKQGSGVEEALKELQSYVTTHMNTDLSSGTNVYPPIQLKYTYERLVQAQNSSSGKTASEIYSDAQNYCEQQNSTDFSGRNRVPCIEQYVQSHPAGKTATVPDALYKFSFVAPSWSPDLAGWSMVVAVISTVLFVVSLAASRWVKS